MATVATDAHNLTAIVDGKGWDYFPTRLPIEQFVQILQTISPKQKTVKVLVSLGE